MWLYHRVTSPNIADRMANSVDPDQTAPLGHSFRSSLIWVFSVCPGISVWKLRIITVHVSGDQFISSVRSLHMPCMFISSNFLYWYEPQKGNICIWFMSCMIRLSCLAILYILETVVFYLSTCITHVSCCTWIKFVTLHLCCATFTFFMGPKYFCFFFNEIVMLLLKQFGYW